ncbi:hypothetical protein [Robiginitalea aurantiaca]|uniref:Uncharacterized protein n=1 Tax=Robiginitalea aurantiaca TaxID=3056915 RepID=A0ABT7WF11_9FLAO|nr:hypothetical protein [Robiginitalea aurantiaca]MDM9631505.1 hypothetical protein [Robiginitalea aurantiaca]
MERIRKIIVSNLTGKKVLLLFLLTNMVYAVMLTVTIPKTMTFSNGLKLLDMMPLGYDLEYINMLFGTLGENGRQVYLTNQLPVDMIYPFLFGISYCLLIGFFLKKLNKLDSFFFYLCFLPLIAGIADYIENFGIITMLYNFPDFSPFTAKVTTVFSVVKSMTTTVFFIALIITLLMLGISKIKERRKTSANTV